MSTPIPDYYKILGVLRTASADEIRQAYLRLVRRYDPDVNSGDDIAEERFKDVQDAYDVLRDPEKRFKYDQLDCFAGTCSAAGSDSHPSATTYSFAEYTERMKTDGTNAMYADSAALRSKDETAPVSAPNLMSYFVDAAVGASAYLLVCFLEIPLAMSKSIVPWLVGPITFSVAGFLRGGGNGRWWVKSGGINLGNWCITASALNGALTAPDLRNTLLWTVTTFVSTACGVAVRRLLVRLDSAALGR